MMEKGRVKRQGKEGRGKYERLPMGRKKLIDHLNTYLYDEKRERTRKRKGKYKRWPLRRKN